MLSVTVSWQLQGANFQTSQRRRSEQLLSLESVAAVGVSVLVTAVCGRVAELVKVYVVCRRAILRAKCSRVQFVQDACMCMHLRTCCGVSRCVGCVFL